MLLGTIVEIFFDLIWIAALVVLCCWFFRIIFGIIGGAAHSVADTFRWTKTSAQREKQKFDCR